jgi:hypothetical protein
MPGPVSDEAPHFPRSSVSQAVLFIAVRLIPMPARVVIGIPCLLLGGSEMAALFFAKALLRYGYNTTLCCYYEHDEEMVRRFERVGVETCLLGLPGAGCPHWDRSCVPWCGSFMRGNRRWFTCSTWPRARSPSWRPRNPGSGRARIHTIV